MYKNDGYFKKGLALKFSSVLRHYLYDRHLVYRFLTPYRFEKTLHFVTA